MKNKTIQKTIGIVVLAILSVIIFSFLSGVALGGLIYVQTFFTEPTIMQTVPSPDGKYVAYVFERNSGATSGWVYHISVLQSDKKLGKGNGNVYINRSMPPESIEWRSNDELYVNDYQSINTTKQKRNINDIKVKYRSLE